MAQQYTLPEIVNWVLSTHIGQLITTCNSGFRTLDTSSLQGPLRRQMYPTYTHIYIIQNKDKSLQKLKWSTEGVGSIGEVLT